jgi:rare lipoprotein A
MNVAKAAAIALVLSTGAVSWISSTQVASAQSGMASWYGPGFQGRRTASGERFNTGSYTAAHRSLPFGTRVRVTNVRNGQSVVVRINDRGPFAGGRIIDLSKASARAIGMGGTARVKLARI